MCGRYTLAGPDLAQVRARFPVGESVEIRRRYNVAPADDVLAVTAGRDGTPRGQLLRWGLIPSWAKSPDIGLKLINARAETVADKPAFRTAFAHMRCLIIADGFYEWRRLDSGRKQAFHITPPDHEPFAFAGLWSVWHPPAGDAGGRPSAAAIDAATPPEANMSQPALRSCAIVTTAATGAITALHDRMPVILHRDAERAWLDSSTPASMLTDVILRSPNLATELRPVGPAVNDARYDGPECLAEPVEDRQTALF